MSYHTPTEFLRVATNTAEHFGFSTSEQLGKHSLCRNCSTPLTHSITAQIKKHDEHDGLLANGITTYCEQKLHALERPTLMYSVDTRPRTNEAAVSFHIFGVERSIAEAILIQAARALASDLGHTEHVVRINSLGDADSLTRYSRELTTFLRKRLDTMSPTARERMKEHPLLALAQLVQEGDDLAFRSPNPLEHLSDNSRKHFREIVEYLDMSDTPYEIDPKMLGHHECYSDALFSVDLLGEYETEAPLTIRGGRMNEFMNRHTRSETPAVGAVVTLKNSTVPSRLPRAKRSTPSVYVVQLGFGPKMRSLLLIETLRQAGIPVHHNLASDSLSTQLREAESQKVRYTIIIGQKEYLEDTVILRDMSVRNQEFIPLANLVRKLKRAKVAA